MRWILAFTLFLGCGTSSPRQASLQQPTTARDPRQLLATLRARRAEVARARPDDYMDRGGDLDLTPLVGLPLEELRSALGQPASCGTEGPIAGRCRSGIWEYVLYHRPDDSVGGGTMLVVEFDAAGRCTYAAWSGRK